MSMRLSLTKRIGPLRLTLSRRGVTVSTTAKRPKRAGR